MALNAKVVSTPPAYEADRDAPITIDTQGRLRVVTPTGAAGLTDTELRATPVSVSINNFPTSQSISGSVSVTNWPASQAVTGTFWPATQPVSGPLTDTQLRASTVPVSVGNFPATQPVSGPLTDAQLRATAVPVSGSFWQATQPVTGTFWPATQPVSGTFWQATQPVSGPLTDTQLRATPVPVSGAFWQATQPISGSVSVSNFPASQAVTGTFWQATQPVSGSVSVSNFPASQAVTGTFWPATQPVSIASMPSTPVTGTFWQATQPVSLATLPKATEATVAMVWTSLKSAAPAAGAVQADTGALAAGDYDFDILMCCSDTAAVGKGLSIEHRNAANGATLQTLSGIPAGVSDVITLRRYTMALNERLRVIVGTAAGAASSMYVSSIGRRLS